MPIPNHPGRINWYLFAKACKLGGCTFTHDCLMNSIDNGTDDKNYDESDSVTRKIMRSDAFEDLIKDIKRYGKNKVSFGKTFYMTFSHRDSLDLYGSLHSVSCWVTGYKKSYGDDYNGVEQEELIINIKIKDTFDFVYNRMDLLSSDKHILSKMGDAANNLAYLAQTIEDLNNFDIEIRIDDYTIDLN